MKDFNFKYRERRKPKEVFRELISDWTFKLYKNQKLANSRLFRNAMINSTLRERPHSFAETLANEKEGISLEMDTITLLEYFPIHEAKKFRRNFKKLVDSLKPYGFFRTESAEELDKLLSRFNSYKGLSWGPLFDNNTGGIKKLDLIRDIHFSYIKGSSTYFILVIQLTPSDKCQRLFKEALNIKPFDKHTIKFNSLKKALKTKRLIRTVTSQPVYPKKYTTKIIHEINYQFKQFAKRKLKLGAYTTSKEYLYPVLLTLEYSGVDSLEKNRFLESYFDIHFFESYLTKNKRYYISLDYPDLINKSTSSIVALYPKLNDEEKKKDQFKTTYNLSRQLILGISAKWILVNEVSRHRVILTAIEKRLARYFKRNDDTIFLKRTIRLSDHITKNWYELKRLGDDFKHKVFERYDEIPDYYQTYVNAKQKNPTEFKSDLTKSSNYVFDETINTYKGLIEYFKSLSQDNQTRSSMRLQAILLIIAILGTLLALVTSDYIKPFLKPLIEKWFNIEFPN